MAEANWYDEGMDWRTPTKQCSLCQQPLTAEMVSATKLPILGGDAPMALVLFAKTLPVLWCPTCDRGTSGLTVADVVQ